MKSIITIEEFLSRKSHVKEDHWIKNIVRFLIPFDLLNKIWNQYLLDNQDFGSIQDRYNTYVYEIYELCINNYSKTFRIHIHIENANDNWYKLITIYDNFGVVFDLNGSFITIYPLGKNTEMPTYVKFKNQLLNHEFDMLSAFKSQHFNDFLAMLLIHNIVKSANISEKYSYPHLEVDSETGDINIAKSDSNKHKVLYAFSKREADAIANRYAQSAPKKDFRHIVYFVNTEFEQNGNIKVANANAESISIKAFMTNLQIPYNEWIKYELAVLFLIYNNNQENLLWLKDPNVYLSYYESIIKKNEAKEVVSRNEYEPISESLFQDALNTLNTTLHFEKDMDYFHLLCAANLVNRYYNDILYNFSKDKTSIEYFEANKKMITFKYHIFNIFRTWIIKKMPFVDIFFGHVVYSDNRISEDDCLFLCMSAGNLSFVFKYRMKSGDKYQQRYMQEFMDSAKREGVRFDIKVKSTFLQPIAQTLYQYAYLLKLDIK